MPPRGDTRNGQQNSLLLHLQLDTVPMYNGDRISGRCASGKLQAPPLPEMKLSPWKASGSLDHKKNSA